MISATVDPITSNACLIPGMWFRAAPQLASFFFSRACCFVKYTHRPNKIANVETTPIKTPMLLSLKGIARFLNMAEV